MKNFTIRKYSPGDEKTLEEITYRTGFKGEDLTGKDYFNDKHLFYLIFIYYYPKFEPENCFVAVERKSGNVIGFICGTTNTRRQEIRFLLHMPWRIILRILTCTFWRYPGTLISLLKMSQVQMGMKSDTEKQAVIKASFPAHLHINIQQEFQRLGLGMRLLQFFENHLSGLDCRGVHLQTTNYNKKAVPFYIKAGYQLVNEVPMKHFRLNDIKLLTFAKDISSIFAVQ